MKKISFLIKLNTKRKLEIVELSEEMKNSYIEKSESNLISSKILLKNERLEEAVSLAYYSMYHILAALLFKIGIKRENHSASIILLKEIFDINNKEIAFAKKEKDAIISYSCGNYKTCTIGQIEEFKLPIWYGATSGLARHCAWTGLHRDYSYSLFFRNNRNFFFSTQIIPFDYFFRNSQTQAQSPFSKFCMKPLHFPVFICHIVQLIHIQNLITAFFAMKILVFNTIRSIAKQLLHLARTF
ncbi:HEPN domain-containing protein [Candidatus Woesearchaeota archaeon]|nr:HEPN domain-containing protein [Candidatus Woesearchaeota archaeon]